VTREFSGNSDISFPSLEWINGTNVIKPSTRDVGSWRSICTRHDPRGPQGNRMDFVGCISIPYDEFSILRSRHEVSWGVWSPVHRIDLRQMPSKCPPRPHLNSSYGLHVCSRLNEGCVTCGLSSILFVGRIVSGMRSVTIEEKTSISDFRVMPKVKIK
jgi:hypothetical protein